MKHFKLMKLFQDLLFAGLICSIIAILIHSIGCTTFKRSKGWTCRDGRVNQPIEKCFEDHTGPHK